MNNMRVLYMLTLVASIMMSCTTKVVTKKIALNSLGYLPGESKVASLAASGQQEFTIRQVKDNNVVFEGTTTKPMFQKDVGDSVVYADFSPLKTVGDYYLETEDHQKSVSFKINEDVYANAFYTATRAMYLWRCGTSVDGECNGIKYHQEACHLDDGHLDYIGQAGQKKDGTGGWHDAGDYGKYTVNAGVSVGVMLMAWENYQASVGEVSLDLPGQSGLPDFLKEIKYETDWLLKMQYDDGSGRVSHKLTRLNFSGFILPDKDKEPRYFSEWSSSATADFVAVMAMAARNFQPYDSAYAQTCLKAAERSYDFLARNLAYKRFGQEAFSTGGYLTTDGDDRLWAAAELWETSGNEKYLTDFQERFSKLETKVESSWDWSNVSNLGVFTYVLSHRNGKAKEIYNEAKNAIVEVADSIYNTSRKDVYGRPLGDNYFWGCNGSVARQAVNLKVAEILTGNQKYRQTRLSIIDHLFGRNVYTRSYVTCLGAHPPMYPHDRRSAADDIEQPWPGYIVGGGHTATDWVDEEGSYSHNEIAINWQSALIYLLAEYARD